MFYIIRKFESIDGVPFYTSVGYVTSEEDVEKCVDTDVVASFNLWVSQNLFELTDGSISCDSFFSENSIDHFYLCDTFTTSVEGQNLEEITDFSTFGGV